MVTAVAVAITPETDGACAGGLLHDHVIGGDHNFAVCCSDFRGASSDSATTSRCSDGTLVLRIADNDNLCIT